MPHFQRLIVCRVPDDFDSKNDFVISPICVIGSELRHPNWLEWQFPSTQLDYDSFLKFSDLFLNQQIVPQLCRYLNTWHRTTHSTEFWRTLIMPYVLELWGAVASSWWILTFALRDWGHLPLTVLGVETTQDWTFKDMGDFSQRGSLNSDFYNWVLTALCKRMMPSNWRMENQELPIGKAEKRGYLSTHRCHAVSGFSALQNDILSAMLHIKGWIKPSRAPERSWRYQNNEALILDAAYESLQSAFKDCVTALLPLIYTDDFQSLAKKSRKKRYRPGSLRVIQTAFSSEEQIKSDLAHAIEAGEIVVGTQHGGSYGVDRHHYSSFELEIKNRWFFSWGWSDHPNVVQMASPICSTYLNRHKAISEEIVWVCAHIAPLSMGCLYSELFGSDWIAYMSGKIEFMTALEPHIWARFRYRPHPSRTNCIDDLPLLTDRFPTLRCHSDLSDSWILNPALLVLDIQSTTLNYAAAANTPFILIMPQSTQLSQSAKPIFAQMRHSNMVFDDHVAAARFINTLDISTWWQSASVQSARLAFVTRFAKTSPIVFRDWIKQLWAL